MKNYEFTKRTFVIGGGRSGKSTFARESAEQMPGPRLFIATAPRLDDEMNSRIERHREERDPALWDTSEEELELSRALEATSDYRTVLLDCLTLWIGNLLHREEQGGGLPEEEWFAERTHELVGVLEGVSANTIIVSNEVGLGIIPENNMARRYRDAVGRSNQIVAAACDSVYTLHAGIPLRLK